MQSKLKSGDKNSSRRASVKTGFFGTLFTTRSKKPTLHETQRQNRRSIDNDELDRGRNPANEHASKSHEPENYLNSQFTSHFVYESNADYDSIPNNSHEDKVFSHLPLANERGNSTTGFQDTPDERFELNAKNNHSFTAYSNN